MSELSDRSSITPSGCSSPRPSSYRTTRYCKLTLRTRDEVGFALLITQILSIQPPSELFSTTGDIMLDFRPLIAFELLCIIEWISNHPCDTTIILYVMLCAPYIYANTSMIKCRCCCVHDCIFLMLMREEISYISFLAPLITLNFGTNTQALTHHFM